MFKVCLCIVTFSVLPPDCENVRAMMAVRRLATAERARPGPGSRQMAPAPASASKLRSSDTRHADIVDNY